MNRDLFYLAWQGIRRKKRDSLLLFLLLFFSFAFAVVTVSSAGSLTATNETYRYETYGAWYGAVLNADADDAAYLAQCEGIAETGVSETYGVLREYTDLWNVRDATGENCLNAAVITAEAAENLTRAAHEEAATLENEADSAGEGTAAWQPAAVTNLFFSRGKDADGDAIREQLVQYLAATAPAGTAKYKFAWNEAAYGETKERQYHIVFAGLIYAVTLPYKILFPMFLTWLAGIAMVRTAVLQAALRQPLTGKFKMAERDAYKTKKVRRRMIFILSAFLCGTVIFGVSEAFAPYFQMRYWQKKDAYLITAEQAVEQADGADAEAFENGETVLCVFLSDMDGNIVYGEKDYADTGVKTGDIISVSIKGTEYAGDGVRETVAASGTVRIGGVLLRAQDEEDYNVSALYEPTGNLDKKTGEDTMRLLLDCTKRMGQTLVMATHDLDIAKKADIVL